MFYIYKSQIKSKEYFCPTWLQLPNPHFLALTEFKRHLHRHLHNELFPTQQLFLQMKHCLASYYSDKLHSLVLPVVAFKARTCHATYTELIHFYSFHVSLVRRKFYSELLLCQTDSQKNASLITLILASLGLTSTVI